MAFCPDKGCGHRRQIHVLIGLCFPGGNKHGSSLILPHFVEEIFLRKKNFLGIFLTRYFARRSLRDILALRLSTKSSRFYLKLRTFKRIGRRRSLLIYMLRNFTAVYPKTNFCHPCDGLSSSLPEYPVSSW